MLLYVCSIVLTEPPYEVSEFGWGEFETRIQLHFHDAMEKPVDIIHMLVLYPPNNQPASTKKVGSGHSYIPQLQIRTEC